MSSALTVPCDCGFNTITARLKDTDTENGLLADNKRNIVLEIRDKVPMTFVTAEPYVGHLGLGGVGDSKGLLESVMRDRHIKCSDCITVIADQCWRYVELIVQYGFFAVWYG